MEGEMINPNDPNMSGQAMDGQMMNNGMMMQNPMNGQMMNNGMMMGNPMGGQMMNNGMMQNPMGGQMMNNGMMQNPMSGQMMNNGMMGAPDMRGQMMNNGMMGNPMGGQMMNGGMMQNPMNAQMMNGGMMQNQMNGQMMNNGMMQNQMNGQMMNGGMMQNQMGGQMMNNAMMQNQMGGQVVPMNTQMMVMNDQPPSAYDEKELLARMEKEMVNSAEVQALVQTVDVKNRDAILMFGREAMTEIQQAAEKALEGEKKSAILEGKRIDLMKEFKKLWGGIDVNELNSDKLGLFGSIKKKIEAFIAKYQTINVEIDKIYVKIKEMEEESRSDSRKLAALYDANLITFHKLVVYIYAAKQCEINIKKEMEEKTMLFNQTQNQEVAQEIEFLKECAREMNKQCMDLTTAQNVSLQNLPMLNMMLLTNYNLIRKANQYFLFGLPTMKQGIAQAIMAKRAKMAADTYSDLDKSMNEMMKRNAQNIVGTAKEAARLTEQSIISAETLEETWKTISNGIDEVNKIQEEGSKKRVEDEKKLQKIKEEYIARLGAPAKPMK